MTSLRHALFTWILPLILILLAGIYAITFTWITSLATDRIFWADDAPKVDVAIVLGAQTSSDGQPLPFLRGRLDAAVELYRAHRIKAILVSGDSRSSTGDEVAVMREYLVREGVSSDDIVTDGESKTTRDSCLRAYQVFKIDRAAVITQQYHLYRTLALCNSAGIEAYGIKANCECRTTTLIRNIAREWIVAQPLAAWDMAVHRSPRLDFAPSDAVDSILRR